VNGTLVFTADDGTNGRELWKSDGTAAGTTLVRDIRPGGSAYPSEFTSVNGTLFFTADDGTNGRQLWRSDGTAAGTLRLSAFALAPGNLASVNGTLFFTATDATHGTELWKSDGTATGIALVKDIYPGGIYDEYGGWHGPFSSSPGNLTNVNGTLFFSASDSSGRGLWKSDGTAAGTVQVKGINSYYEVAFTWPREVTNINGTLFFLVDTGPSVYGTVGRLWQSDGTSAGTLLVSDLVCRSLTNVQGKLLFTADDGIHGRELWTLVEDAAQGTSLAVSGFPAAVTAGVAGSLTVTARNANGSTNTGYRGTVHFTSSDPQAVLPGDYTFTAADQGVHTFSATLKTAGSQSITAKDTVVPGVAGTQGGITVKAAAASRLTVAGFPTPVTAGVAGSLTVTAWDAYGNRATGYTGTVRFTSSDPRAVLPGKHTFTLADAGTHTFSAVLKTTGMQSLAVTDTASAAVAGTQSVTVNPAASRLLLSAPASVNAGAKFSLTVTVVDAYGNVVTGYQGTLKFSSSDPTATLPRNYTFTAADPGVHTFTGLVLKKKGRQTITPTDTLDGSPTASVLIDVR
jgi:ELWxxDGT repeat protein